jgi:opacity protein-like surface antigen
MKSYSFKLKKLSHLTLIVIFLFTLSKQSFAQKKSFFEGSYVGGAIGYTTYKTRFNDPANGEPPNNWYLVFDGDVYKTSDNLDGKNINGTISTGYNWIFDKNYILGLEAEASSGKKIVHSSTTQNSEWGADINYIANLRLKAGTIHEDKNLFYVTVGPAMAKARYSARYTDGGRSLGFDGDGEFPISINKTVYGLSYGVGVERQIDDKTSMKLEYMLTDLDSKSKPYPGSGDGTGCAYPPSCVGPSWKTKISSIRIGYNYHF